MGFFFFFSLRLIFYQRFLENCTGSQKHGFTLSPLDIKAPSFWGYFYNFATKEKEREKYEKTSDF